MVPWNKGSGRDWSDPETRRKYNRDDTRRRNAEGKTWAKRNPDKVRIKRRKRTLRQYGITPEQWDTKFNEQNRACAICLRTDPAGPHWATDHDHTTGAFRAILCSRCNTGIGQFEDDPLRLRLAAEYLESHKG